MKGFKILDYNDVQGPLEVFHKEGAKLGKYVGFDSFNDLYSMKESGCTDWTGYPQSGKTEMLLEMLFNTSEFYGWKHLLLVPDIGDMVEVMAILIHKYSGKTFNKKYNNFIDIQTVYKSTSWLLEHFFIMEKTDPKAKISPVEFWEYAVEFKKKHNIQTATIDSWKDLYHDYKNNGGSYAVYLSNILPIRNMLAEINNIHFHTVVHPKNPRRDNTGKIPHPDVDDMEGGAQWNNSGKSIISIHRATIDTKVADVKILKAKPSSVGKRGFLAINFDVTKSRYYEIDASEGGYNVYAHKENVSIKKQVQPNKDFTEAINYNENPF